MAQSQIFISYSHQNHPFAYKLYDGLLSSGYWVWMDERLKPAQKWEPQIEDNLRKSEYFLALLSSKSVDSDWVRHEGSMAYALNLRLVIVQIEPLGKDSYDKLPIWAKPIQIHRLFDGSSNYDDKFEELKQLLGTPLPIRQYLEEMVIHYQNSGVLLEEAALALIDRHYDELHLPKDKKDLADKLIRESRLKLDGYWIRYAKLEHDYKQGQKEIDKLKKENEKFRTDHIIDIGAFIALIIILSLLLLRLISWAYGFI